MPRSAAQRSSASTRSSGSSWTRLAIAWPQSQKVHANGQPRLVSKTAASSGASSPDASSPSNVPSRYGDAVSRKSSPPRRARGAVVATLPPSRTAKPGIDASARPSRHAASRAGKTRSPSPWTRTSTAGCAREKRLGRRRTSRHRRPARDHTQRRIARAGERGDGEGVALVPGVERDGRGRPRAPASAATSAGARRRARISNATSGWTRRALATTRPAASGGARRVVAPSNWARITRTRRR